MLKLTRPSTLLGSMTNVVNIGFCSPVLMQQGLIWIATSIFGPSMVTVTGTVENEPYGIGNLHLATDPDRGVHFDAWILLGTLTKLMRQVRWSMRADPVCTSRFNSRFFDALAGSCNVMSLQQPFSSRSRSMHHCKQFLLHLSIKASIFRFSVSANRLSKASRQSLDWKTSI